MYLPTKKKIKNNFDSSKFFKRSEFKLKPKILVPLWKDTLVDGKVVKWKYDFVEIDNPAYRSSDTRGNVRYLYAGRYFKPRVDGIIRLIFENVPKGQDVKVGVDFVDKNLEDASTFSNYLNSFSSQLKAQVDNETDTSKKKVVAAAVDSVNKEVKEAEKIQNTLKNEQEIQSNEIQKKIDKIDNIKNELAGLAAKNQRQSNK